MCDSVSEQQLLSALGWFSPVFQSNVAVCLTHLLSHVDMVLLWYCYGTAVVLTGYVQPDTHS